jgi:hypothetical protein
MFFSSSRVVFLFAVTCSCLISGSFWSAPTVSAQSEKKVKYKLPENANEVIFVYDEQNGFTPPRKNNAPVLLIRANGIIEMPSLYGKGRDIKGKISAEDLQAFLHFVIAENKFIDFDASTVQGQIEDIRKKRQVPQIADAPDTIVELKIPGYSQSVRQAAVGMPSEFKEVTAFQQLLTIRKRIARLMSETRVGGKEGIEKLLGPINKQLNTEYPDVAPLRVSDFGGAYLRQDGTVSATISRPGRDSEGKPNGTYVAATAVVSSDSEEPVVTLRVKLK